MKIKENEITSRIKNCRLKLSAFFGKEIRFQFIYIMVLTSLGWIQI